MVCEDRCLSAGSIPATINPWKTLILNTFSKWAVTKRSWGSTGSGWVYIWKLDIEAISVCCRKLCLWLSSALIQKEEYLLWTSQHSAMLEKSVFREKCKIGGPVYALKMLWYLLLELWVLSRQNLSLGNFILPTWNSPAVPVCCGFLFLV